MAARARDGGRVDPPSSRNSSMSMITTNADTKTCFTARMNGDRCVDPAVAHEVAAAYLDAPSRRDAVTDAAYARLAAESDALFRRITSPDRPDAVRVVFTSCPTPYRDARELIGAVTNDRTLEVTISTTGRRHPVMEGAPRGAYDRFRAVHDIVGHARLGLGFDRDGE